MALKVLVAGELKSATPKIMMGGVLKDVCMKVMQGGALKDIECAAPTPLIIDSFNPSTYEPSGRMAYTDHPGENFFEFNGSYDNYSGTYSATLSYGVSEEQMRLATEALPEHLGLMAGSTITIELMETTNVDSIAGTASYPTVVSGRDTFTPEYAVYPDGYQIPEGSAYAYVGEFVLDEDMTFAILQSIFTVNTSALPTLTYTRGEVRYNLTLKNFELY